MKYLNLLLSVILLSLAGCMIIPIPTQEHNYCYDLWADNCESFRTRGEITKENVEFIRVGSTAKEEVLLKLGAPNVVKGNETIFEYHWLMVSGYTQWAVGLWPGLGAAGGIARFSRHVLTVEFDENNVVSRHEIRSRESG